MHVNFHSDLASLTPLATAWNDLADGVPFRSWEWLETWWRHYGCLEDGRPKRDHQLFVLTVWDDDNRLIAIAPWYRQHTRSGARVIRFLGDGEVCSDYLTVLCKPGQDIQAADALADWLSVRSQTFASPNSTAPTQHPNTIRRHTRVNADYRWDRLEFIGVAASDIAVNHLLATLQACGNMIHHGRTPNSWRVALPSSWNEFLMILSKPHRNRLRRADKNYFQSGKVQSLQVQRPDEVARFFDILVHLHQGRWQRRGLPGCFASPAFQSFHREIAARFYAEGRVTLSWLEMDGAPLAAEYRLHGNNMMCAYQCGIDTDRLDVKPGELANMAAIKNAISRGQMAYDFLRGDEPYKAHWRATPVPMLNVRVIPPRPSARLRHSAWVTAKNVKHWIKRRLEPASQRKPQPILQESESSHGVLR
jgi:CelD/BcsL family acetyltransferase involved in cellulose biosynthesis